jgi:hypothetical protein
MVEDKAGAGFESVCLTIPASIGFPILTATGAGNMLSGFVVAIRLICFQ